MTQGRWTRTVIGLAIGMAALAVVTAILSSAVSSSHASDQITALAIQLGDANRQLDVLRANADASNARSAQASKERADLMTQNSALQHEVRALLRFLRAHGIPVPVNVVTSSTGTGQSNRPKVHRPSRPHPQGPVIPGPRPGTASILTELCTLLPTLCP